MHVGVHATVAANRATTAYVTSISHAKYSYYDS
jgi:hypothetical protein